jgi:hypothetical protein
VDALLEHVRTAGGAVPEQRERVVRLDVLAQHDHADLGVRVAQRSRHLYAFVGACRRHPDVGDDGVGLVLLDFGEEAIAILADGHHLDLRVACEHLLDRLAREEGIVGNHDPDHP